MSEDATIKQIQGSRIAEKAALFSLSAFFSKVLGLLRDLTVAQTVPLTVSDAWVLAFRIPHFLRRLFSEGSATAFFWGREQTLKSFFLWSLTWAALVFLMSWGVLSFPKIFGFEQLWPELANDFYLGMIFYIWSLGVSAYLLAVAHQRKKLIMAAFVPVLMNLVVLLSLWISDDLQFRLSESLSWAGALQILILLPQLRGLEKGQWCGSDFGSRFSYFIQTAFAFSYLQYLGLLTVFAIGGETSGDLSFYFWAERLLEFPLALISTSFGLAGVFLLAENTRERSLYFQHSLKWLLPSALGLFVAREQVILLLFGGQRFSPGEFSLFAQLLGTLSFLLVLMGLYKMLLWVLVAQKNLFSVKSLLFHFAVAPAVLFLMQQLGQTGLLEVLQIFLFLSAFIVIHCGWKLKEKQKILRELSQQIPIPLFASVMMGLILFGLQQVVMTETRLLAGGLIGCGAIFYLGLFQILKRMIPERGTLG